MKRENLMIICFTIVLCVAGFLFVIDRDSNNRFDVESYKLQTERAKLYIDAVGGGKLPPSTQQQPKAPDNPAFKTL